MKKHVVELSISTSRKVPVAHAYNSTCDWVDFSKARSSKDPISTERNLGMVVCACCLRQAKSRKRLGLI
jgi:hypothetical protein